MIWILLVSLLIAALRFAVPGHALGWAGTYEAFAHIWVGVLLGMILCASCTVRYFLLLARRRELIWILVGITGVETVKFLLK